MCLADIYHSFDARSPSFEIGSFVHNLRYVEVARFGTVQCLYVFRRYPCREATGIADFNSVIINTKLQPFSIIIIPTVTESVDHPFTQSFIGDFKLFFSFEMGMP